MAKGVWSKKSKRTSSGNIRSSKWGSSTLINWSSSSSIDLKELATTSAKVVSNANSKATSAKTLIKIKKSFEWVDFLSIIGIK